MPLGRNSSYYIRDRTEASIQSVRDALENNKTDWHRTSDHKTPYITKKYSHGINTPYFENIMHQLLV